MLRFLLDENVPVSIGLFLQAKGHDVLIVRQSPLVGSTDDDIWRCAVDEQRIIITHDKDFPLPGAHGVPAGIILLKAHGLRAAATQQLFEHSWGHIKPADVLHHIVVIEPGRLRSRRL